MNKSRKLKQFLNNFDFWMLGAAFFSTIFGILLIYSAGLSGGTQSRDVTVQMVAFIIGIVCMAVIIFIDIDLFHAAYLFIGGISLFILLIVLFVGTGAEEVGTKGWIILGPVSIQPSEIAKVGFIISLAGHLSRVDEHVNAPKTLLLLVLHFACFAALVLAQPDWGTTMVFAFIFICMIFIAGVRLRYFLAAGIVGVLCAVPAWFFVLDTFQRERILTFLNPERAPLAEGYQVLQSKLAIGSGMIGGNGYMQGTQTQMGYLPQARTDFIYAVGGEEFGFVGSIAILLLLMLIVWRVIRCAQSTKDKFSEYICIGVCAFYLFHIIENIGMCIGITPVTGIPLPFFSSGGSNLIASYMALGLALNVRMGRKSFY